MNITPEEQRIMDQVMAEPIPPPDKPKMPGRNEPCICGSGKKFKKCCGNLAGSARVIVVDPTTGEVLRDKGTRVALFKEFMGAAMAAARTGWHRNPNTELVTLSETKWRQMAAEIPCAEVSLVELESSSPPIQMESSESAAPSPGTTEKTSDASSE